MQNSINFIDSIRQNKLLMISSDRNSLLLSETMDSLLHLIPKTINKLTQFESLPLYRKLERPNLNNEKLKTIGDQLELEEKARTNLNNRKYHNNYMFNIDYNPFTDQFNLEGSPTAKKKTSHNFDIDEIDTEPIAKNDQHSEKGQNGKHNPSKVINIIEEIRKYKNKKVELRGNMSQPLKDLMNDKQRFSNQIQEIQSIKPKKSPLKIEAQTETITTRYLKAKNDPIYFSDALDLNQIISMKDKNFFQSEHIRNIFKFAFHPSALLNAGKSKLDSYYFCHNSMKEVIQKRKLPIYRDISRFSRYLIMEIRPNEDKSNYMDLKESNPSLNEPTIEAVLSISAGRIKSDELLSLILQDFRTTPGQKDEITTSSIEEKVIDYPENTKNFAALKQDDVNGTNQAQEFLEFSLESNQRKYSNRLKSDVEIFKKSLDEQKKLLRVNILDRKLMSQLEGKSRDLLQKMYFIKFEEKDKDRLIRKNKIFKDRYEELKIKSLIKAAKFQKEHERFVASKFSTRSKSKTPTKSIPKPK